MPYVWRLWPYTFFVVWLLAWLASPVCEDWALNTRFRYRISKCMFYIFRRLSLKCSHVDIRSPSRWNITVETRRDVLQINGKVRILIRLMSHADWVCKGILHRPHTSDDVWDCSRKQRWMRWLTQITTDVIYEGSIWLTDWTEPFDSRVCLRRTTVISNTHIECLSVSSRQRTRISNCRHYYKLDWQYVCTSNNIQSNYIHLHSPNR